MRRDGEIEVPKVSEVSKVSKAGSPCGARFQFTGSPCEVLVSVILGYQTEFGF